MAEFPSLTGIALITGAASGIGKETAYTFAEAGCSGIVFADFNEEGANAAAKDSQKYATNKEYKTLVIKVDVSDPDSVQNMVNLTVDTFGRIDYSVNAAGIGEFTMTPTASVDLKDFDRILNTNLKGTVYCVKAVLAAMIAQEPLTFTSSRPRSEGRGPRNLGRGAIVNLGSVYSHLADYGLLAYTVAKHGVMGVTKAAALDHAGNGIRVNAVCPGSVDTPIMQKGITDIPPLAQIIEKTVLLGGRMAHVEEVAGAIAFLCSPSASYITGTGLTIDGGATLNVSSL